MTAPPDLAVILAAGRGTRMQADASAAAGLDADQRALAAAGRKALVPIGGRPFLSWVLDAVAEAGFAAACIVAGDDRDAVEAAVRGHGLRVTVAHQVRPRGTADAVLAAEATAAGQNFIVINGDNHYPAGALRRLREVPPPATVGFPQGTRTAAYALMRVDARGCLVDIVEKPDAAVRGAMGPKAPVSMTCWSFTPAIFAHCRSLRPSPRGELELPDAVRRLAGSVCVRVEAHGGPVLDLGTASDIASVARALGA